MAQRDIEWKLECRKRELDLLRRKREDEMAVFSVQNQFEVAHLEHEILGQEFNEGKTPVCYLCTIYLWFIAQVLHQVSLS